MKTLNAERLKRMQEQKEDLLLVNTLDEEHFADTRIQGAINIPQSQEDFVQRVEQRAGSKDKTLVVYCASQECESSARAAQKLEEAGFSNVFDFEGGAHGWQEAGQRLEVA